MASTAHFDVQALGESTWREDWDAPLERMGLAFLAQLSRGDVHGPIPDEPPYHAMLIHLRDKPYTAAQCSPVPRNWPWIVKALEPPVERGLMNDPLSDAYEEGWRPPPRARSAALAFGDT
jgi:hypothetical protein